MSLESFNRQTVFVWVVSALLIGFALFVVVFISAPAIKWQITSPDLRHTLDNKPLPDDWTWTQIILWDLGIILSIGYLASQPIIQALTKFTDEGIDQPSLFQRKTIYWQDVQKISITTNIVIAGSQTKIDLNPILFSNPHALINELRSRVPSSAFPNDERVLQEVKNHMRNASGRATIGAILFGVLIFIFGKDLVAYLFGVAVIGYGVFESRKWLKLGRAP